MFNTTFVGTGVLDCPQQSNFGRDVVFSADLYYNEVDDEMDKEKELPKRKPTRLKNFDYSSAGAYFVKICIRDRMHILSEIVKTDLTATDKTNGLSVGEGLAPPEITVKLKPCGYR